MFVTIQRCERNSLLCLKCELTSSPLDIWRTVGPCSQASSPDELALVMGAKGAGFWFKQRLGSQACFAARRVCQPASGPSLAAGPSKTLR